VSAACGPRLLPATAAFAFALAVSSTSPCAAAEPRDSFHDLLAVYRCEVVHRLEQIHATGDAAVDRNRYIAVTVPDHPHGYVQCIFHDRLTKIYCEAASGFYLDKDRAARTFHQPARAIAALARLGFDTDDSAGNFKTDVDVGDPPDFNAIADFILRALHDGYGARGSMNLRFNVPFAPRAPSTCVPVS
jgi:hypothetical protein